MQWSLYSYLGIAAAFSIALFALFIYCLPKIVLSQEYPRKTTEEMLLLGLIMALGLITIYWNFYSGTHCFAYADVGSDTIEQYIPYYINLFKSIQAGDFGFWNYSFGLGASFSSYQSWTLDPFNLALFPLLMLTGIEHLSLALVVIHSLRVLLAAFLFDHLLLSYCSTPIARVVGASLYGFGGYLLLWGQHYWLGTTYVIVVILLIALEALLREWSVRAFLGVFFSFFLSVVMSIYIGFMVGLFAALYGIIRSLSFSNSFKAWGGTVLSMAAPAFLGCVSGSFILIPYGTLLLGESARIGTDSSGLLTQILHYGSTFFPLDWWPLTLSRFFGDSLISSNTPYSDNLISFFSDFPYVNIYEIIMVGASCGVLVLTSLFIHWVFTEGRARDKVVAILVSLLLFFYCTNLFLPALTNAFVAPKYRSSFVVSVVLCITMAIAFERRITLSSPPKSMLLMSFTATLAILAWSLLHTINGRLVCISFVVCTLILFYALWNLDKPSRRNHLLAITVFVLVLSSVVDGFFTTNNRDFVSLENFPYLEQPGKDSSTQDALSYLHKTDSSLYRVEKLYTDWSSLSDSLIQGYYGVSAYNSTADADTIRFMRELWPEILPGDSAYQRFREDPLNRAMLKILGVRYLLAKEPIGAEWLELIHTSGDIYIYRNTDSPEMVLFYNSLIPESTIEEIPSLSSRRELCLQNGIVEDGVLDSIALSDTKGTATVRTCKRTGQTLSFVIDAKNTTVCDLAVPYSPAWDVYIDDSKASTFRINYGFVGFELPQGEHTVTARFSIPNLGVGAIISCIGFFLAGLTCFLRQRCAIVCPTSH